MNLRGRPRPLLSHVHMSAKGTIDAIQARFFLMSLALDYLRRCTKVLCKWTCQIPVIRMAAAGPPQLC